MPLQKTRRNRFLITTLIAACLSSAFFVEQANAEVKLPGFFGDHMVLQQQERMKVWGWAEPGESVEVSLGNRMAKTTADDDGTWRIEFPAMQASTKAITFRVKGTNTIELKDVLVGEVWLCSGQSNMEWPVRASKNSKEEATAANYPLIRHMKVAHRPSNVPLHDVPSKWEICSPETAPNFTACGYFMARKLLKELNVPIGLVNSSWGGTRVEPWTPPIGFAKVEAVNNIYQSVLKRTPGTTENKEGVTAHIAATKKWLTEAEAALQSNQPVPAMPKAPEALNPYRSHQDPTMLYNGMIHALVGFPIRGAIWYQGESNHNEGMLYYEKKKALINGWRELWNQGDFPFYFVQIAPFRYGNEDPKVLARFWEAQHRVTKLANTEMVVINDIATIGDIHPPNKQDVGLRLANLALRYDYGKETVVANSPEFESMEIVQGAGEDSVKQLKLKFKHSAGGLKTRDGQAPTYFEVAGEDGQFMEATASIVDDTVIISSEKVRSPVAFRFAWNKIAEPNLMGGTGLPVGACRGGKLPE